MLERKAAVAGRVDHPHGVVDAIVYGPVASRRYGQTLGINVLPPARKVCRYSCVYCQLGHDRRPSADENAFPSVAAVEAALAHFDTLGPHGRIDALVVCGNGEPTLHPRFAEVVGTVLAARDARWPGVPVVCLTAGTELDRPEVMRALRRFDECAVKLDAGRCETLQRLALPDGPACVRWLSDRIRALGDAVVQTCFVRGALTNASDTEVDAWIEAVWNASPRRVDVYTIARPPPSVRVQPVGRGRLKEIAARLVSRTGLSVRVADAVSGS